MLDVFPYEDEQHLIEHLEDGVLHPVNTWMEETNKEEVRERLLTEAREEIKDLKQRLKEQEKK